MTNTNCNDPVEANGIYCSRNIEMLDIINTGCNQTETGNAECNYQEVIDEYCSKMSRYGEGKSNLLISSSI